MRCRLTSPSHQESGDQRSHERRKGDDDSRKADSQRCGQDGSVVDAGQEAGSQGCMPGRTGVKKWITMATETWASTNQMKTHGEDRDHRGVDDHHGVEGEGIPGRPES